MTPPKKTNQTKEAKPAKGKASSITKLTLKQSLFIKEYLIDLNATQAAIRAGYSAKTAQVIGAENLSKPIISDAIKTEMDKRAGKIELTAENVLQSIIQIRGMAMEAEKLNDALKANELLGKHLKLFTDKTELTGADGAPLDLTVNFPSSSLNKTT